MTGHSGFSHGHAGRKGADILIGVAIAMLFCCSCMNGLLSHDKKYHEVLREYSRYETDETQAIAFSYMDSSDTNLARLKDTYNLAEIAGDGDDLSAIVNLMLWVNRNLTHDGQAENPYPPNAPNIIGTCQKEHGSVNCRMLAIVLNEFYLSLGYKSRIVTCEPYEHDYTDCHVVTVVYASRLDKWIMMDPTFAGYFKDENGRFLGLSEIRERLVNGEPLIASEHLSHNGGTFSQREYLSFMLPNLFRFSCPLVSAFNYEALDFDKRAYVELIPGEYVSNQRQTTYTRNPDIFWAGPATAAHR